MERRNLADSGCFFEFPGGGPEQAGPAQPQAQLGLPDSEGGVTQEAFTTRGTPGDLSGQFPHTCHIGI